MTLLNCLLYTYMGKHRCVLYDEAVRDKVCILSLCAYQFVEIYSVYYRILSFLLNSLKYCLPCNLVTITIEAATYIALCVLILLLCYLLFSVPYVDLLVVSQLMKTLWDPVSSEALLFI